MKVLVIGSGGREHALAWKLSQSPLVSEIISAPGNPGISELGRSIDMDDEDIDCIVKLAKDEKIDLAVVGPEAPLVNGVADRLRNEGIRVFGPTAAAARIEGSKAWANDLMYRYGIPCPDSRVFNDSRLAIEYIRAKPEGALVVKADGLAAGKGVMIPESYEDAEAAVRDALDAGGFGDAGNKIVIEDRLMGPELSVFAFVDGNDVSSVAAVRDYKRAYDGDAGLNTGGMGAFTSPMLCSASALDDIRRDIMLPMARALVEEGSPYQGILYGGLMLTDSGLQVIEFNCRFGDPECELLMMRLESDLAALCLAVSEGRLSEMEANWNNDYAVGVVIVSGNYPEAYDTGYRISGALETGADKMIFHAGTTTNDDGYLVTAGGRVLVATASSSQSISDARREAYSMVSKIQFQNARARSDIAIEAD